MRVILFLAIVIYTAFWFQEDITQVFQLKQVVAFMLLSFIGGYSFAYAGTDHQENISEEYPDGRLTYPGDEE